MAGGMILPGQSASYQNGLWTPPNNSQGGAAAAGYAWDPVQGKYGRTPTAAGSRLNQFETAAFPSLAGITGGAASAFGGSGGTGAATGAGGPVGSGGPVSSGSAAPQIQMPDMTQSNSAIFAQAKDQVGKSSRASLDSLNGELGAQGMLGGGAQAQATRDVVNNNASELGQVSRDQATTGANMAADFAKTGYQGSITQRGQDIAAQEANARLALEQRQQQYQLLSMALQGLNGASSGANSNSFLF